VLLLVREEEVEDEKLFVELIVRSAREVIKTFSEKLNKERRAA